MYPAKSIRYNEGCLPAQTNCQKRSTPLLGSGLVSSWSVLTPSLPSSNPINPSLNPQVHPVGIFFFCCFWNIPHNTSCVIYRLSEQVPRDPSLIDTVLWEPVRLTPTRVGPGILRKTSSLRLGGVSCFFDLHVALSKGHQGLNCNRSEVGQGNSDQ